MCFLFKEINLNFFVSISKREDKMSVAGQLPANWPYPVDAEVVLTGSSIAGERVDSGCDMSSAGADSPTSYRRLQQDDNSTSSFTCSSCEATVDQNSAVYQELTKTLAHARLNNITLSDSVGLSHLPGCKSYVPLIGADEKQAECLYVNEEKKKEGDDQQPTLPSSQLIPNPFPVPTKSRKDRGRLLPQVLASLALAIAAMIEGYSSGYTSPALASMTHENSTIPVNDHQVKLFKLPKVRINILMKFLDSGLLDRKFDASQRPTGRDFRGKHHRTIRTEKGHHAHWTALHLV